MINQASNFGYLTEGLPGTGGTIRACPEDFIVEEVPLYLPSGTGNHLYLLIEKQGMPTFEAVWKLSKALGQKPGSFGLAGLKDADAVTRQYLSIEGVSEKEVSNLAIDGIRILDVSYHRNKLKTGHLKGNRFRIVIQKPLRHGKAEAVEVLEHLKARGAPNFFGPQRFGLYNNTHLLGAALIKRDWQSFVDILVTTPRGDTGSCPEHEQVVACYRKGDYEGALAHLGRNSKYERQVLSALSRKPDRIDRAVARIEKRMLRFYLSAFQSDLFNQYLAQRMDRIDQLENGEIATLHRNGASFLVEDALKEADRVAGFEISPSGPLFGAKMLQAQGACGLLEQELLQKAGLRLDEIRGIFGIALKGARRPLRIPLGDYDIEEIDRGLLLSFFLPHGSYATVLLREVMKNEKKVVPD